MLDVATVAIAFGSIFLIELPDKTFVATLVMATRFRPLYVWIGVSLAFLVQTVVAVLLGGLLAQLPRTPVEIFAMAMFLIGGFLLLRGASHAVEEEHEAEEEFGEKAAQGAAKGPVSGWKVIGLCFGILFLAEWGDLSQILTASLVLKYHDPVSVFVGALLALMAVSGLAAILGRALIGRIPLVLIRRIGGVICLILAGVTGLQLLGAF